MAEFFGYEGASGNGIGAEGYVVANGQVFPANSGPWTADGLPYGQGGDSPPGHWTHGDPQASGGKGERDPAGHSVFFPIGTGPAQAPMKDGRPGHVAVRTEVGFHFDGGNPGTNGCIGYQQSAAKDAIIAEGNDTADISYYPNLQAVQDAIEAKLGHKVDWAKAEEGRRHIPGFGPPDPGVHSATVKKHKVKKGVPHVKLGPKARQTAHLDAPLDDGSKIADASTSVFVGEERKRVARVNDQTTDGSPLAVGESSILVG